MNILKRVNPENLNLFVRNRGKRGLDGYHEKFAESYMLGRLCLNEYSGAAWSLLARLLQPRNFPECTIDY